MADTHGVAELASTIQSASINRDPDPQRDINPSTAASKLEPVVVESSPAASDVGEDEIPISILRPPPRKRSLPPLPDLRFEQSYLKSIEHANGSAGVAYITVRDQVLFPLIQGVLWTLVVAGWRHWNRASRFSGASVGARIRRWWWGVNNWKVPEDSAKRGGLGEDAKDIYGVKLGTGGD